MVLGLTGVLLVLFSPLVLPQEQEYDGYSDVNWHVDRPQAGKESYLKGLDTMGAADLVSTYNGSGTAIVQFEYGVAFIDARLGSKDMPGKFVFGNCERVSAANTGRSDATGWAPGGNDCKIAWVMCFEGMPNSSLTDGAPARTQLERRNTACAATETSETKDRAHATNVAAGLATVASGAKIIAIQTNTSYAFKRAVEWLLHPSSDTAWYLVNDYTLEEAAYYAKTFGGLSPAKYWNVVATNASINVLAYEDADVNQTISAAFSSVCKATPNPDVSSLAPYEYVRDWQKQYLYRSLLLEVQTEIVDLYNLQMQADEIVQAVFDVTVEYYEPYIAMLRDHGIIPFFAASNNLAWDAAARKGFVTPNGIGFPACLPGSVAVSGARSDYHLARYQDDPASRRRYISSNAHSTMTDYVVPAMSATSYSTPVAAAAVAVLKSVNLAPNADIEMIAGYLNQGALLSDLPEISAEISCHPAAVYALPFPGGFPFFADASLDCMAESYTLPVMHLGNAIQLAAQDRLAVKIDIRPSSPVNTVFPTSTRTINVAVLSTSTGDGDAINFDATQVDAYKLKFGIGEAANIAIPRVRDVDGDKDIDVIYAFNTRDAGIACMDNEASLIGETYAGELFTGTDSIVTADCVANSCHP